MDSYTKLRIIGTGSFGTVWLIRSKLNQRNYVLKEIPLSSVQEKERTFVLNEVKVLSGLRHKNIVRYKEAFLNNGLLCISMEFAHEGDMSNKIQEQAGRMFPQEQVIDWFIQLCLSLKYIHGRNILHRDIKSQNIFLAKDSVIKLGDFGIACVLQNTLDHAKTIIGTPYYLSPEICQRQPYNHKSDIWALGCVLYEMMTLKHPFESQDFTGLVLKILHADYEDISRIHGPLLSDVIGVLLRVEPSERPSAKQILHIPAMKTHVDKVLGRGRMQRCESVSCAAPKEDVVPPHTARSVWRKPSEVSRVERPVTVASKQPDDATTRGRKDTICLRESVRTICEESNYVEKKNLITQSFKPKQVEHPREDMHESKQQQPTCEMRIRGKRPSSEAFCIEEHSVFVEEGTPVQAKKPLMTEKCAKKCIADGQKKICYVEQRVPTKRRSYSTSHVRERGAREPVMPIKPQHPVLLRETYDVVNGQRQVNGETFTIDSRSRAGLKEERSSFEPNDNASEKPHSALSNATRPTQGDEKHEKERKTRAGFQGDEKRNKKRENERKTRGGFQGDEKRENEIKTRDVFQRNEKRENERKTREGEEKRGVDFVKVLLTTNRCSLGDISPKDSISTYIRSIRSHLERVLGCERFEAVYRYIAVDVQREMETGTYITARLLETLGEENVSCIPLVMQLMQCEGLFT